ncbi:DUF805 domain-containing protein [Rhizobium sp. Rhizsp82]|uniref:DUF805 domain-containing protein n=1 Tax=Rhizobium sp. Rhizsp82 TaxID=3243057 RepID=UPI0039B4BC11
MSDFLEVWARSFQFGGRLDRKAYWTAFIWHIGVVAFLSVLDILFGLFPVRPNLMIGTLGFLYLVVAIPANWTSTVRRLHDANYSGWWVSLCLIPYIGTPIVMLLCARASVGEATRFDGEDASLAPGYAVLKGGRLEMPEPKTSDSRQA